VVVGGDQWRVRKVASKAVGGDGGYQGSRECGRRLKELFHLSPMEFRTFCRRREFAA